MKNLTVFCSSKNNLNPIYYAECSKLISLLNPNNISIVYGGGTTGLMGTVRNTFLENSGTVITSNMTKFVEPGIYDNYIFDNLLLQLAKLVEEGFITKNLEKINTYVISDPEILANKINELL